MARRPPPQLDMNNLPRGLRPLEAAAVLGLASTTYYRHVHPHVVRGEILSVPIGTQRRILTTSLLAWFEQQAEKGTWQ